MFYENKDEVMLKSEISVATKIRGVILSGVEGVGWDLHCRVVNTSFYSLSDSATIDVFV